MTGSRTRSALALAVATVALSACAAGPSAPEQTSSSASGTSSAAGSSASDSGSTTATPGGPSGSDSRSGDSPTRPSATAARTCVERTAARLSPAQQAGQLLMVAVTPGGAGAAAQQVGDLHLGSVFYLGGWSGHDLVRTTSATLQAQAGPRATADVKLLVAADQEGGQVQQLRGPGFSAMPAGVVQGTWPTRRLRTAAKAWGTELRTAGVNVDLAPVADTVPAALGRGNGPIGRWDRQLGSDPDRVARADRAFVAGMADAGVTTSVKHFPGIGRLRGNTDFTAEGTVDATTTADDPYLQPFRDGIDAGAGMVMLSTATYPKLDARRPAAFSRAVIATLLRDELGWDGVVITDDVGSAASVQHIPVGQRATRHIAAGGDIVLTADPALAAPMAAAIRETAEDDPRFRAHVEKSVERVLTLKDDLGLLPCSEDAAR